MTWKTGMPDWIAWTAVAWLALGLYLQAVLYAKENVGMPWPIAFTIGPPAIAAVVATGVVFVPVLLCLRIRSSRETVGFMGREWAVRHVSALGFTILITRGGPKG